MVISQRTFGVEIECFGGRRSARALAHTTLVRTLRAAGLSVTDLFDGEPRDHEYQTWILKNDSSIEPDHGYNLEIVSPILRGVAGLGQVRLVCKILKDASYNVNSSCGLHVHIGAEDLTASEIYSIIERYAEGEDVINTFIQPYRRNSEWCHPAKPQLRHVLGSFSRWKNTVEGRNPRCTMEDPCCRYLGYGTVDQMVEVRPGRFEGQGYQYCGRNMPPCGRVHISNTEIVNPFHSTRTMCRAAGERWGRDARVNCDAFRHHGTIEFRHHHASVDAKEITNWIQFLNNFLEVSMEFAPKRDDQGTITTPAKRTRKTGPMAGLPTYLRTILRGQARRIAEVADGTLNP